MEELNTGDELWGKIIFRYRVRKAKPYIAGVGLIAIIAVSYVFIFQKPDYEMIQTYAEAQSVSLPDGSVAFLNKESFLQYSEDDFDDKREVEIGGEVFFSIKEVGKPFKLVAGSNVSVSMLSGTVNILQYKDYVKIESSNTVGIAMINGRHYGFQPLEKVIINSEGTQKLRVDHKFSGGEWRTGIYNFEKIPKQYAMELLCSYNNKNLTSSRPISTELYSGVIRNSDGLEYNVRTILNDPYPSIRIDSTSVSIHYSTALLGLFNRDGDLNLSRATQGNQRN